MRARSRAAALALLVPLWSCRASAPPPRSSIELPSSWLADEGAVAQARPGALDAWWTTLGDGRLDALVREALRHNRDLGAAAARLEVALAEARAAGALRSPTLDLGADASRRRQNFIGLPIPGGGVLSSTSSSFGVSLDLAWEVDLWDRLGAGARAAAADAQASAADLHAAALSLAAQTARAWFALIEARQQLALARVTAASFEQSADWIRARYERGLAAALDLRLALSNAADARAATAASDEQVERVARQLEVLLGRYPRGEVERGGELPPAPPAPPPGLPAELLERRPDLVAARARVTALDERAAAARAARLPGLRLTASGGRASNELEDLLDGDLSVWSLGAGLTAPLFQAGRLRAQADAAEARRDEAWMAWERDVLRACAEVESALAAAEPLARRSSQLREAAREARAAEELARERYRSGVEPLVTLLEAQRRAAQNESRWLAARRAQLDNRIDLLLALGGGFPASAGPAPAALASETSTGDRP